MSNQTQTSHKRSGVFRRYPCRVSCADHEGWYEAVSLNQLCEGTTTLLISGTLQTRKTADPKLSLTPKRHGKGQQKHRKGERRNEHGPEGHKKESPPDNSERDSL